MLILYGVNLSTFTRKVRLALAEKGLDYRFETAAMGSPQVKALNPLGRIPVLKDDDLVVPDSSVIVAYLERRFPAQPLYPSDDAELARALWVEEYADTRLRETTLPFFSEGVVKPLYMGKPGDQDAITRAIPGRDESLDYLESIAPEAGFFCGAILTIADIAVGAQLVTYTQGGGALPSDRWHRLASLYDRLCARPAWAPILAEESQALDAARARRAR